MIAALFIEVFARLLGRLAGFAARVQAGAVPLPAPRAAGVPRLVAAPAAPGLPSRVFGWLGGLLPMGRTVALFPATALPHVAAPSARHRVAALRPIGVAAHNDLGDPASGASDEQAAESLAAWERVHNLPALVAAPAWAGVSPAAWLRLPASTAGPPSGPGFLRWYLHVYIVTVS